jgi:phosphatidylserine decarboxylase precursor-related protein
VLIFAHFCILRLTLLPLDTYKNFPQFFQKVLSHQVSETCPQIFRFLIINRLEVSIFVMRIPLTKYGLPQVVVLPAVIVVAMAVLFWAGRTQGAILAAEVILAVVLIFVLSFFRDPYRIPPADEKNLLAPADGKIADIETVEEREFIGGKALRIGIFLSIFDVHINRSPCNVKVEKITYKKGGFKDARNTQAIFFNESNDLFLIRKTPASSCRKTEAGDK